MTLNANAVRVAGTGEVYVAPTATAAPTDAATALPAAWIGLGYTSTDGVAFTMSRDTTDIDAWQGSKLRTVSNAEPTSFEFALMETDPQTFPVVFGGGTVVAGTPAGEFVYEPPAEGENEIRSAIVEFHDGDVTYRYYFPRVQVEGDVAFDVEIGYPAKSQIPGFRKALVAAAKTVAGVENVSMGIRLYEVEGLHAV